MKIFSLPFHPKAPLLSFKAPLFLLLKRQLLSKKLHLAIKSSLFENFIISFRTQHFEA